MQPRIVGIAGPFQGQTLPLPEGEVTLGRDHSSQLWSSDAALSRRHCAFVRAGDEVRLKDLASRNGTRVNSVPANEQLLRHGDQISVGFSLFVFLQEDEAEETHSNPVVFEDTNSITGTAFLLPQQESEFLLSQNEAASRGTSSPARVRSDLNALLKFATAIGSIRDRDSLEWQLLGFVFDVIPAERGSLLLLDSKGDVSSTRAWDRVHGPENAVPVNQPVLRKVISERSGLLLTDAGSSRVRKDSRTATEEHSLSLL